MNPNANNPSLMVDHTPYPWESSTITGAQLRDLAKIPAGVLIFLKIPGQKDRPIADNDSVDLSKPGIEQFSTQAPGSQAG